MSSEAVEDSSSDRTVDCSDYVPNIRANYSKIAREIRHSLTDLTNELFSCELINKEEQSNARNRNFPALDRASTILDIVMVKIKNDKSDRYYDEFVAALKASDLQGVVKILNPEVDVARKPSASDSGCSLSSRMDSLSMSERIVGNKCHEVPSRSASDTLTRDGASVPQESCPHQKLQDNGEARFSSGRQPARSHQGSSEVVTQGYKPLFNAPGQMRTDSMNNPSNNLVDTPFGSSNPTGTLPDRHSAPLGPSSGDYFQETRTVHNYEVTHYRKTIQSMHYQQESGWVVTEHYKKLCDDKDTRIRELEQSLADAREKRRELEEEKKVLSHKLQETEQVCLRFEQLVAQGARDGKIDKDLLQYFERLNSSATENIFVS